jgi:hypothetical protein
MNKIKIYHYSNSDFSGFVEPKFFGGNFYSRNSERISNVKRCYFYSDIASFKIEHRFLTAFYLYTSEIDKNTLYDLDSNKIKNFTDIYDSAKKLGYKGVIKDNIVALFYSTKIIKKEKND